MTSGWPSVSRHTTEIGKFSARGDPGHALKILIVFAFWWQSNADWLSLLLLRIHDAFVFHAPCSVPVISCNALIDVLADANARS